MHGEPDATIVDTHGKLDRVPDQPKTPIHGFRIPDTRYYRAQELAAIFHDTLTDEVNRAFDRYIQRRERDLERMTPANRSALIKAAKKPRARKKKR